MQEQKEGALAVSVTLAELQRVVACAPISSDSDTKVPREAAPAAAIVPPPSTLVEHELDPRPESKGSTRETLDDKHSVKAVMLGEYRLEEAELGRGAFAAVFRAVDGQGRQFTIKRFYANTGDDIADREVESLSRIWTGGLSSPFLVRFFHTIRDAGDENFRKGVALVFELCEDGSLVDFINRRQMRLQPFLTRAELLTAAIHLTSALSALHSHRLLHRDIALRNILVARSSQKRIVLKMADLCLSKAVHTPSDKTELMKVDLYSAPEQQRDTDFRSDVFSLGLVLYELAAMQHLDITDSKTDINEAIAAMRPERDEVRKRLSSDVFRQRYGDALVTVILNMLAEDVAVRHTAASALHALSLIDTTGQ